MPWRISFAQRSSDKARNLLVLLQFHIEGFVNMYRQAAATEGRASLVFESEAFENFSNLWKAREIYEFLSDDEFIETFELAAPGKPFEGHAFAAAALPHALFKP